MRDLSWDELDVRMPARIARRVNKMDLAVQTTTAGIRELARTQQYAGTMVAKDLIYLQYLIDEGKPLTRAERAAMRQLVQAYLDDLLQLTEELADVIGLELRTR